MDSDTARGPSESVEYSPPWVSIYATGNKTTIIGPGVEVHLPGEWSDFQQNLLFQALAPANESLRRKGSSHE